MGKLTLGHGSGGRLTQELISEITGVFPENAKISELEDCAFIGNGYAMTIDGFTVSPRTFPGGDIGELAICGSANDLAVRGVKPEYISLSVIVEEGFELQELKTYMKSAADICSRLGIKLAAGDTKVVPVGSVDGIFITTCAVGRSVPGNPLGMTNIQPGDTILVTTSIGRHGAAVGASRFDLQAEGLTSDCAPLWEPLKELLDLEGLRSMRDCTRGGLGTVMCEWAEGRGLGIEINEEDIPISSEVQSVCDILGFDPLYLACEGCAAIAIAPEDAEEALKRLAGHHLCKEASAIGTVVEAHPALVGLRTSIGGMRIVDMPVGEMLPRIC